MNRKDFIRQFRTRPYLHFDLPVRSPNCAWKYVSDPKNIETHPFIPFLGFRITTQKIRRSDEDATIPRRQRKIVIKPKHREIKIASHKDAAIYYFYGKILEEKYEEQLKKIGLTDEVTAFRSRSVGNSNVDCAKEVFDYIKENRSCTVLTFDVTKFFDNLCHYYLRNVWKGLLQEERLPLDHYQVFRSLTRFSWVHRNTVYRKFDISTFNPKLIRSAEKRKRICSTREFREHVRGGGLIRINDEQRGIPQGSPMSAVLSNIYMLQFDQEVKKRVSALSGMYRRYCDDIIVVVPSGEAEQVSNFVYSEIQTVGLECNAEKTERVDFPANGCAANASKLQYLGFTFDGISIRIRQSSLDKYYGKMRRGVRFARKCHRKAIRRAIRAGKSEWKDIPAMRTRKVYLAYSHLISSLRSGKLGAGRRFKYSKINFISYGLRASTQFSSQEIRKQLRGHLSKIRREVLKQEAKNKRFFERAKRMP